MLRRCCVAIAGLLIGFSLLATQADAAPTEFVQGAGAAAANVYGMNVPYGGANLGIGVGEAKTKYFEENSYASAQRINPTIIGTSNLVALCGTTSPITPPVALQADTNQTGGKPDVKVTGSNGADSAVLSEKAAAYPGSRAVADAIGGELGLSGLAQMSGGVAHAETIMNPKAKTRTSVTDVRIGEISLLNGMAVLGDMHWHLELQVNGDDDRADTVVQKATFTIGSGSLLGKSYSFNSTDKMTSSLDTFNAKLQPLGVGLRLPKIIQVSKKSAKYTPFTVVLGGDPAYGKVLYPLLAGTDGPSVVNLFFKLDPSVFDPAHCKELYGLLEHAPQVNFLLNYLGVITPIVVSAVAAAIHGGAEFNIDFGGASLSLDDTYYAPPPVPKFVDPPLIDIPGTPGTPGYLSPGRPGSARQVASVTGKTTRSCASTSSTGSRGCFGGHAGVAAGVAGVVLLALLGAEEVVRRRNQTSHSEGTSIA